MRTTNLREMLHSVTL